MMPVDSGCFQAVPNGSCTHDHVVKHMHLHPAPECALLHRSLLAPHACMHAAAGTPARQARLGKDSALPLPPDLMWSPAWARLARANGLHYMPM